MYRYEAKRKIENGPNSKYDDLPISLRAISAFAH